MPKIPAQPAPEPFDSMTFQVLVERDALGLPDSDIEENIGVLRDVSSEIIARIGAEPNTRNRRLAVYAIGYYLDGLDKGSAVGRRYD